MTVQKKDSSILYQVGKPVVLLKKSPRRRKAWLAIAAAGFIVVLVVVHVVSTPAHGRPTHSGGKLVVQPHHTATATPASTIQTAYFDLPLPAGYRQQGSVAVPNLLYSQSLIKAADFGSLIITLSLRAMPDGGLEGDSNYRLRSQQSGRYHLNNQIVKGDTVAVANDSQSAAVTAFLPHGGYLAAISVTSGLGNPAGGGNSDELAALQPLLQAWQWR